MNKLQASDKKNVALLQALAASDSEHGRAMQVDPRLTQGWPRAGPGLTGLGLSA